MAFVLKQVNKALPHGDYADNGWYKAGKSIASWIPFVGDALDLAFELSETVIGVAGAAGLQVHGSDTSDCSPRFDFVNRNSIFGSPKGVDPIWGSVKPKKMIKV